MDTIARIRNLYQAGQLETAQIAVRELCAEDSLNADAWWLLGCITRHLGLVGLSDDGFRRAAELLPTQMPMPYRISAEHFRELVLEAKRVLAESGTASITGDKAGPQEPPDLQSAKAILQSSRAASHWGIAAPGHAAAARIKTRVEYLPSREAILNGLSPDAQWSRPVDAVILYQANHENAAGSDRDLVHRLVRNLIFALAIGPASGTLTESA